MSVWILNPQKNSLDFFFDSTNFFRIFLDFFSDFFYEFSWVYQDFINKKDLNTEFEELFTPK